MWVSQGRWEGEGLSLLIEVVRDERQLLVTLLTGCQWPLALGSPCAGLHSVSPRMTQHAAVSCCWFRDSRFSLTPAQQLKYDVIVEVERAGVGFDSRDSNPGLRVRIALH